MMKKIALLLAVIMLLSMPTVGFASEDVATEVTGVTEEIEATTVNEAVEDTELPEAGITPDSWLYGLDKFMKELRLLITFDAADKAGLLDKICGERLAEAREMVEANKDKYGMIAMKAYKAVLEKTVEVLDDAILNEKDIDSVLKQFTANQLEREKLAAIILEEIPEELRAEIEKELQDTKDELDVTIEVTDYESETEDTDETAVDTDAEDTDETDIDDVDTEEEVAEGDSEDSDEETNEGDETNQDEEANEGEEGNQDEETNEGDVTNQDEETNQDENDESAGEAEVEDEEGENAAPVLPLKKQVTVKILEETLGEAAAQMYANGELNLCQIMTVYSLAKQTEKTFDEVLDIFLENGKGIGATAKALGLHPRRALKGIKGDFKGVKKQIKKGFAEAKKDCKKNKPIKDLENEYTKDEETKKDAVKTQEQAPANEEIKEDTSKTLDKTVVQKVELQKLNIQSSNKNSSGNWKTYDKKDKMSSKDDDDKYDHEDDDDDKDNKWGNRWNNWNNKDNKNSKSYKGTNQSYRRSDRAKERSNRK